MAAGRLGSTGSIFRFNNSAHLSPTPRLALLTPSCCVPSCNVHSEPSRAIQSREPRVSAPPSSPSSPDFKLSLPPSPLNDLQNAQRHVCTRNPIPQSFLSRFPLYTGHPPDAKNPASLSSSLLSFGAEKAPAGRVLRVAATQKRKKKMGGH